MTDRVLMRLQSSAGNAAVARLLVQRKGDGGSCPPPPVEPSPPNPRADPKFKKMAVDTKKSTAELTKHPPATDEARKAADAAEAPSDDKIGQAKAGQVDKMGTAKPKAFDKPGFIAAVKRAIASSAPQNLQEADSFADSSGPSRITAMVKSVVDKGKQDSGKDVAEKTKQAPDPSVAKDKQVVPLKEAAPPVPGAVDGASAMPGKAPPEQVDLRAGACEVDAKLEGQGITEKQLLASNEGPMQEAVAAKQEAETHAAEAPGDVRQKEAATLQSAKGGAGADTKAALKGMSGTNTQVTGKVASQKAAAKAKEEADRARVSREINAIFDATKTETGAILEGIDAQVATVFDTGEAEAKVAFTAKHTTDMARYKDQRYSGVEGAARWVADELTSMPPEADQIFVRAKALYESMMSEVISRVADLVGSELDRATQRIDRGRKDIRTYVENQPKELKKLAGETADEVGTQFDDLETQVRDKGQAVVNDVAQRYVEARNQVDEEIKAEQEKNKGLVDKAADAVEGAVDTITKLKDLFMGVLAKAANAFDKILDDPIAFIGNFMSAIKQGFMSFADNILDHLKKGLMGWLLGALANAGIEIPDSFDLKGILKLVASILGLTWSSIKARILRLAPWVGKAIDFIESKIEVFAILATQGVVGVWEWIKDKVGDLQEMILGPIKEFVVEKIIRAGVTWVLGLLNPAGALVKIVQALVGVVQWVIERGAQLGEFVSNVIDSVSDIAHGGVGGVPAKIEGALSKAVPLVISFMANLLGLGGISEKIREVLEAVQKPVGKAIDAVIKGALNAAKKLLSTVKGMFKKKGKGEAGGDDATTAKKAAQEGYAAATQVPLGGIGAALSGVRARWSPQGVKRLELLPKGDGYFTVKASVNPDAEAPAMAKVDVEKTPELERLVLGSGPGELAAKSFASGTTSASGTFETETTPEYTELLASGATKGELNLSNSQVGAHAEEQVTNLFQTAWENHAKKVAVAVKEKLKARREEWKKKKKEARAAGKPEPELPPPPSALWAERAELVYQVSKSSCINCASHIARFVGLLRRKAKSVSASMSFAALYQGKQEVPASAVDPSTQSGQLVRLFVAQGKLKRTGGLARLWGRLTRRGEGKEASVEVSGGKAGGKAGLAILRAAGIKVDALTGEETAGGGEGAGTEERLLLEKRNEALKKALADVEKELAKQGTAG